MFLIYVPVLSVTLYFSAKIFLPDTTRRALSRVASHIIFALAFTVARTVRYLAALRSWYIWEKRGRLGRPLVSVLDTLLKVDKGQALVDTSSGHESISIQRAISTVNGRDYDVTKILDDMWAYGDGMRIDIPINVALEWCRNQNKSTGDSIDIDTDVTTRIRYVDTVTFQSGTHRRHFP